MNLEDEYEIVDAEPAPEARTYEEFIRETNETSNTYEVNGIHYYLKNETDSTPVKKLMREHGECNACTSRSGKMFSLTGKDGPAFLSNIRCFHDGCDKGCLFKVHEKVLELNKTPKSLKFHIVKADTFPKVGEGICEEENRTYEHVTIHPDKHTSQENYQKYGLLLEEYITIVCPRLEKICDSEAVASVRLISDAVNAGGVDSYQMNRPDHWKSVLNWVTGIQDHVSGITYDKMSKAKRIHLAVFAITTGRSEVDRETVVHLDYKQAANIIDFLTLTSIEAVLREMDTRSDPNSYRVSQLSRRLEQEQVSSDHTISLTWPGEFTDDLDIHVQVPQDYLLENNGMVGDYREMYYGCKILRAHGAKVYRLDFDANVNRGEAEPAENVSVGPGTFKIFVNNFTRRTRNQDIPFSIHLRQKGKEEIIIDRVWPLDRPQGDKMLIGEHTFTEVSSQVPEMSEKAAKRAEVLDPKWNKYMGEPTSKVPVLEEMSIPAYVWSNKSESEEIVEDVNSSFMNMAIKKKNESVSKKKYLSQHEADRPDTLTKLLTNLGEGVHSVKVDPRNFAPGYVTEITTNDKVTHNPYNLCHYEDKFSVPTKPEKNGNARFNESWFKNGIMYRDVTVNSFIQFGKNWFMVIDGLLLPHIDSDFPLCGGFRATNLTANFHDLRDRWTFCNTKILPTVKDEGTPIIGSFLVSDTVTLTVDGTQTTVKVE